MTNYDELVKRLRMHAERVSSGINEDCQEAADVLARLQADLKEAVEALNPLGDVAKIYEHYEAEDPIFAGFDRGVQRRITVGDLRRAAAIVAKHEGKKG